MLNNKHCGKQKRERERNNLVGKKQSNAWAERDNSSRSAGMKDGGGKARSEKRIFGLKSTYEIVSLPDCSQQNSRNLYPHTATLTISSQETKVPFLQNLDERHSGFRQPEWQRQAWDMGSIIGN